MWQTPLHGQLLSVESEIKVGAVVESELKARSTPSHSSPTLSRNGRVSIMRFVSLFFALIVLVFLKGSMPGPSV